MKRSDLKNQVIFVELEKKVTVHEIVTSARYGQPEWFYTEEENLRLAGILDTADIKFALWSEHGKFFIMVSEKDAEKALRLLEEK